MRYLRDLSHSIAFSFLLEFDKDPVRRIMVTGIQMEDV